MPEDAWIKTVPESDADGPLAEIYDRCRDPRHGGVDNILKVHSLNPQSLADHLSLYRNVMHARCGLTRAEREMVAVVVSDINACHYWLTHHRAGLARLVQRTHPAGFADQLGADYARLELSNRERAMLDYAAKLTRTPSEMAESDLTPLRSAGLTDRDILDLNLCVAYFAYVNRIADGLGVRLEPHWSDA